MSLPASSSARTTMSPSPSQRPFSWPASKPPFDVRAPSRNRSAHWARSFSTTPPAPFPWRGSHRVPIDKNYHHSRSHGQTDMSGQRKSKSAILCACFLIVHSIPTKPIRPSPWGTFWRQAPTPIRLLTITVRCSTMPPPLSSTPLAIMTQYP